VNERLDHSREELHLSHYWNIIRKRWKVAASILLSVLVATLLVSFLTKPLYKSKVVLQIERENPNQLTVEDLFMIESSSQEFLQTQYALLKSRGLASRVITDLNLLNDPKFNPGGTKGLTAVQREALKSGFVGQVMGNIEVYPVKSTSLVEVYYTAPDASLAQKVVNGIADTFVTMTVERKYETFKHAAAFLTSEIAQLEQEILTAESDLQTYSRSKDIISLGNAENITVQKLTELNKDLTLAQSDRIQKEARYLTLRTASGDAIPEVSNNTLITTLRAEKSRLEREYGQKLGVFKPEHPELVQLRNQIDKTGQALASELLAVIAKVRESARNEYLSAVAREQAMRNALEAQKRETQTMNANAVTYTNLRQNIDTKRTLLDQLRQRLNETEVTARLRGSNNSNIHFVERAETPGYRFNASLGKNVKNAIPLGMVLGLAAIFFLEYMDRSIKSPEEVERLTGFASLGIIPSNESVKGRSGQMYGEPRPRPVEDQPGVEVVDLIPHTDPRSPIAEAYRALRTSLLLASADSPQVIVITSTLPREGKTTTAANLAVVFSQIGKGVLLIDADLRKPRLRKMFKTHGEVGLVNYLTGNAPVEEIIQETSIPHLSIIESGPIPPNPSELLASERMRQLLAWGRESYAFVILDSPPVLAVTDAVVLATNADGVVLTIHGGVTPREVVQRAAERLRMSNIHVLGALLNNLDLKQHSPTYAQSYYEYYAQDQQPTPEKKRRFKAV
jgi:polysaccharide biosynthesis transport protein